MIIKFTTWEEWNDALAKMNAGLVVCPDCSKWVNRLHEIPEEYENLDYRALVIFYRDNPGFRTEDEIRVNLERKKDKKKTGYCCDSCLSGLAKEKEKLDLEEKYDYCQFCEQWVEKGSTELYRRNGRDSALRYCPECLAFVVSEYEFMKQNEKEHKRVVYHNRRTAELGLTSDLTLREWLDVINQYGDKCTECGEAWTDLDHIIPVSKGGGTTKSNVRPLCGHCNSVKRDRVLELLTH